MNIYTYIHACIHMRICIYVFQSIYIYVRTYMSVYIHLYISIWIYNSHFQQFSASFFFFLQILRVAACEFNHSYAWHDAFIWVTRLIWCVTCLIHVRDMTHSYVSHEAFTCDINSSYVWHDAFICVTRRFHIFDITQLMGDMTRLRMCCNFFRAVASWMNSCAHSYTYCHTHTLHTRTQIIYTWDII